MEADYAHVALNVKKMAVVAYALLVAAIVYLIFNSPATGYELSIYDAILPFWVLVLAAMSVAIITLLYQAYMKCYEKFWYVFLVLLIGSFVIFTLPLSRGYYIYGGNDPSAHLDTLIAIVNTGHVQSDYYPMTHLFGACLEILGNIAGNTAVQLIPPTLSILFILFSYHLASAVFNKKEYAIIAAAVSSIPLFAYYHVTIYPHATALLLLPVIFYLYFKSIGSQNYRILLFVMIVLMVFIHVIPSLIIIGCLVSAEIVRYISAKIFLRSSNNISFMPAVLSGIVFFTWWSSYAVFDSVGNVYDWFAGETQLVPRTGEVASTATIGQQGMIDLYLKMYGNQLGLTILSLIAIVAIIYYFLKKKEELTNALAMVAILLSSALTYVMIFLTGGFMTMGRFLGANYGVWAMPVVASFLFTKLNVSKFKYLLTSAIIITLLIVAMLSVYRSPWILQPNWQYTYQDTDAYSWFSSHKAYIYSVGVIGSPWGQVPTGGWTWSSYVYTPPHFGYDNFTMYGESVYKDSLIYFGETRQTLASESDVLTDSPLSGTWALPEINSADMIKLNNDESVYNVYSNGDVEILYVKGLKTSPSGTS